MYHECCVGLKHNRENTWSVQRWPRSVPCPVCTINGAASTGKKVTMFFTFWDPMPSKTSKAICQKGIFLVKCSVWCCHQPVKHCHFRKWIRVVPAVMMRHTAKNKRIDSQSMIQQGHRQRCRNTVCTMSMDVMGVKPRERIDNAQLGCSLSERGTG